MTNQARVALSSRLLPKLKKGQGSVIRFFILIGIIIFAGALNPAFLGAFNINSILVMVCIYGFLGLAQTMVMFIGELNLT